MGDAATAPTRHPGAQDARATRKAAKLAAFASKTWDRCTHSLEPVRRGFCSRLRLPGSLLCADHAVLAGGAADAAAAAGRVPCPLDPKHTVLSTKLTRHLRVCGVAKLAAAATSAPGWSLDVNAGVAVPGGVSPAPPRPLEELLALIEVWHKDAVRARTAPHVLSPPSAAALADALALVAPPPGGGAGGTSPASRHLVQQIAICDVAQTRGLFTGETPLVVEFGAGRATLSLALARVHPGLPLLVVESGKQKFRADSKIAATAGASVSRVRLDIKDLSLTAHLAATGGAATGAPGLEARPVVGIGKHACGVATDFSLRAVAAYSAGAARAAEACGEGGVAPPATGARPVCGLALAPCCHHVCSWRAYVGKPFWLRVLRATPVDFTAVAALSSGATLAREGGDAEGEEGGGGPGGAPPPTSSLGDAGLPLLARKRVGVLAKELIEEGRARFLEALGGACEVVTYCGMGVTPENRMLCWRSTIGEALPQ